MVTQINLHGEYGGYKTKAAGYCIFSYVEHNWVKLQSTSQEEVSYSKCLGSTYHKANLATCMSQHLLLSHVFVSTLQCMCLCDSSSAKCLCGPMCWPCTLSGLHIYICLLCFWSFIGFTHYYGWSLYFCYYFFWHRPFFLVVSWNLHRM